MFWRKIKKKGKCCYAYRYIQWIINVGWKASHVQSLMCIYTVIKGIVISWLLVQLFTFLCRFHKLWRPRNDSVAYGLDLGGTSNVLYSSIPTNYRNIVLKLDAILRVLICRRSLFQKGDYVTLMKGNSKKGIVLLYSTKERPITLNIYIQNTYFYLVSPVISCL